MEINSTNGGAATYALKKSMEMPNLLVSLLQDSTINQAGSFAENRIASAPVDASKETMKGRYIDVVA